MPSEQSQPPTPKQTLQCPSLPPQPPPSRRARPLELTHAQCGPRPAAEQEESAARRAAGSHWQLGRRLRLVCQRRESVCPPLLPPPLERMERWEVLGTAGGWVGVGDLVLKSHLVLENGGQSASLPRPRLPAFSTPTAATPPIYQLDCFTRVAWLLWAVI